MSTTIRALITILAALLCVGALAGCKIDWLDALGIHKHNDNTARVGNTNVPGLDVAVSDYGFAQTYANLEQAMGSNNYYRTLKTDLQSEAGNAGRSIRPTRVILYQDPGRMTPLIAADRRAGLDLPPAMLVYQDSRNNVGVAYNSSDYLAARYDLAAAKDALDGLGRDEATLANDASGQNISRTGSVSSIGQGEGLVDRTSAHGFDTTLANLISAIKNNSNLQLLQQFDHRAAAHSIGSMLDANDDPSTLVVFDAGAEQARVIAGGQTVAVDLPARILVSQDTDGTVNVSYSQPSYLETRHNVAAANAIRDFDGTLRSLVGKAVN
ncbi:DUF302 domain-containing protein [Salinisphaera sp. SWV1]|uniref:DUF302 domain-containing protein n=1 Tax=Salinisphaera sp. SWV1 TaxID=3454139 RepID=UPI003F874BBF